MPDDATPEAVDIDERRARSVLGALTRPPDPGGNHRAVAMRNGRTSIVSGHGNAVASVASGDRYVCDALLAAFNEAPVVIGSLLAEVTRLRAALRAISDIRDSIVGAQGFNFSEHAYPLVAVLDGAGFKGVGYETARANLGTLIGQVKAAESALTTERRTVEELRAALGEVLDVAGKWCAELNTYRTGHGKALTCDTRFGEWRTLAGPR